MSRALALVALTHLRYMHSEQPFMLELASSPLVKLPCSPPRTIPAFGRLARKGGCTSSAAGGIVGSSSARCRPSTGCVLWAWAASEPLLRQRNIDFHAPPCKRCWRLLTAQLGADRIRAVLKGYTWLEALAWPTRRSRQGSSKFACCRCDPVKHGGREDGMICSVGA